MEWTQNRKWFAIALIGIIVPIGFLTTLKLTGVISEPLPVETITADAIVWSFQRPTSLPPTTPRYSIQNSYADETITANLEIRGVYWWDASGPFGDAFSLGCCINATVRKGFIHSVGVYFCEKNCSYAVFDSPTTLMDLTNVTVVYRNFGYMSNSTQAYIKAMGVNKPTGISLSRPFIWAYLDQQNHDLEITAKILYWNGSSYMMIIIPIIMNTYF